MNLIGWNEVFDVPRPGWPGRRRAIARQLAKVVAAAVLAIALMAIAFAFIWLGAPEGAAWPR